MVAAFPTNMKGRGMKPFGNAAMTGCSSQKRRVPPQTAILHVYALLPEASC